MNLLARPCLVLFSLVLFLFSCESESDIGQPLNPNGDNFGVFYEEVPVTTSVVLLDSVNTLGTFTVGRYADPDFGTTQSQAFTQFLPEKANLAIPENVVIDSIVFQLRVNNYHGIDFNTPSTIDAHLLTERIERTIVNSRQLKFAFNTTPYNQLPIGSTTFSINPNTDSLLRIKLAPEELYKNNWVEQTKNYKATDSANVNSFLDAVKGLALVPGEENSFIIGFDLFHPQSTISMFYHDAADSVISFRYKFDFSNSANILITQSYSNLTTDRSQTSLAGIVPNTEFAPADDFIYLQSGTGLLPKVNIDNIKTFIESAGDIVINRADLVLADVQPFSKFLAPPSTLSLFFTDEANKLSYVRSNLTQRNVALAVTMPGADPSTPLEARILEESYKIQLTDILEAYYLGRIPYNQFLVYPKWIDGPTTLNQAKFPKDNIKLKIYYTKLK